MKAVTLYIAACGLLVLLFAAVPALDIETARLFYRPEDGFYLRDSRLAVFSYELINVLEYLLYAFATALVLIHFVPPLARFRVRPSAIASIVLAFALGPGLVTNTLLKNEIGRARPAQVTEFGGTRAYTPPAVPADQCERNCAFVTGHGALAFGFAVFAFLLAPGPARRRALAAALAFGALVGLGRMVQGAHWLSDVVFAGLINVAIAWAVVEWLDRRGGFDRLARRLRRAGG